MWSVRAVVRGVLSLVLLGAGLSAPLVLAAPAQACTCIEQSTGSLAEGADSVFVGTALKQENSAGAAATTFLVTDVYKGAAGGEVTVSATSGETACGVDFQTDTQYLIVANGARDKLTTNTCLGSQEVNDQVIDDVRKSLGEPTSYRPTGDDNNAEDNTDKGQSDDESGDKSGDNSSATEETAADTSDDDDSDIGTTLVVGAVLILGFGLAFLAPRLRRRNRE